MTDLVPEKAEVKQEFDQKRRERGISSFMAKWVKRNYSFGVEGVPFGESDWLKVIYGFDGTFLLLLSLFLLANLAPLFCQSPNCRRR